MERLDGRRPDQLRPVRIVPGYLPNAEGSALIEQGGTVVLCAVSVEDRLPAFLRDKGGGWVTAEYGMLPRSTHTRSPREAAQGRVGGRTHEIQRLIGRALRAVTRLDILGERTFTVDCDVIQADAGTRCAAITGAYVALRQACETMLARRALSTMPLRDALAAVSVGVVGGVPLLDLTYEEDSRAEADFNIVQTASGEFVEVQGSAESAPFPRATARRGAAARRCGHPRAVGGAESGSSSRRDVFVERVTPQAYSPSQAPPRTWMWPCCCVWRASAPKLESRRKPFGQNFSPIWIATSPACPRSAPELLLRHVLSRHDEKHHRDPAKAVSEDDDLVILKDDFSRRPPGDDLAEQAMVDHPWLRRYARGSRGPF